MAEKTELMDEADLISANEKLTAENAQLKKELSIVTQAVAVAEADAKSEKARADKAESDLVAAELARSDLALAANEANTKAEAALKAKAETDAKMVDFNKAVATEVARLGIRHEAAAEKPAEKAAVAKPKTLTEKVLEYHGVKTLGELETRKK